MPIDKSAEFEASATPTIGSYQDIDLRRFREGTIRAPDLYRRWKKRLGLSLWEDVLQDLAVSLWAIAQALRGLLTGQAQQDLAQQYSKRR